jgi:hypothetical protein
MRKLLLLGLVLMGCCAVVGAAMATNNNTHNFFAHLSGAEEVPSRETRAVGQAVCHLNEDGTEIEYTLIIVHIETVVAAHIHVAPVGVNGSVVAGPFPAGGGRIDGVLAQGTMTAANLVGPLAGHPLSDLVDAMTAGNTYVNVHTNDGIDPAIHGRV